MLVYRRKTKTIGMLHREEQIFMTHKRISNMRENSNNSTKTRWLTANNVYIVRRVGQFLLRGGRILDKFHPMDSYNIKGDYLMRQKRTSLLSLRSVCIVCYVLNKAFWDIAYLFSFRRPTASNTPWPKALNRDHQPLASLCCFSLGSDLTSPCVEFFSIATGNFCLGRKEEEEEEETKTRNKKQHEIFIYEVYIRGRWLLKPHVK